MCRCNIVTNAHKKQRRLRFRSHVVTLLIRKMRRNVDKVDVEILMQEWVICSRKTKESCVRFESRSISRSCRTEFSNDRFDLEIKWVSRRWRCKSLLNAKISWQKRQIWEKQKIVAECFDAKLAICEVLAVRLIEANSIDVELWEIMQRYCHSIDLLSA